MSSKEHKRAYDAERYQRRKAEYKARAKIWAQKNKKRRQEIAQQSAARCRARNPEAARKRCREWFKRNPDKATAYVMARYTTKKQAMPKWLTSQQKEWIKMWYTMAKAMERNLGGKWHVDHIVPLQGKNVSGLHVPWNLQVLPAVENIKKGNKL